MIKAIYLPFSGLVKRAWRKTIKHQERRAAYWQLQNMTDKQLTDIGVSRCELRRRVFEY